MPVTFRCDACRGKLSISRRKIGHQVDCPKCGQPVTVPGGESVAEEMTEMLASLQQPTVGSPNAVAAPPDPPVTRRAHRPAAKPAPKPQPKATPKRLEDMPLFERTDFDELLDPALKRKYDEPEPLPLPDDIPDRRIAATPPGVDPDAIILSRTTATLFVVAFVVMLGLAFAAGFLIGG